MLPLIVSMKSIQFFGAAGGVTGSSYILIGDNGESILIDLGMFQGTADEDQLNAAPLAFDVKNLKAVFLTHAHLDHCGRLPFLIKAGYTGKIYATEATKLIVHLSLMDSAALAEEDKRKEVIYSKEDVENVSILIQPVVYGKEITIGEFIVTLRDAGHILGSASIEVKNRTQKIVFSGDLGNTPEDLIRPTENIVSSDIVVMESTYGDRIHPQDDVSAFFQKEINEIEKTAGVLLIPAFSIERTQEVLHQISHLRKDGKIKNTTPVFLDSPMAIEVTAIFKEFPDLFNEELAHDKHPFDFSNLMFTRTVTDSKAILEVKPPKIIIAGSGMMSGGRILHHLDNYVEDPATRILIVGYQAVGTLGRAIVDGATEIELYGQKVKVRAKISQLEALSSHADQPKLLAWLKKIKGVKQVFLTHGEEESRKILAGKIKSELHIRNIELPKINQKYNLK